MSESLEINVQEVEAALIDISQFEDSGRPWQIRRYRVAKGVVKLFDKAALAGFTIDFKNKHYPKTFERLQSLAKNNSKIVISKPIS